MQYIAQGDEDAEQVCDCGGGCKRSRVDSFGSIEEVVTPLLQISRDVRALGVNLHDLFVDGVGEVLQLPLAHRHARPACEAYMPQAALSRKTITSSLSHSHMYLGHLHATLHRAHIMDTETCEAMPKVNKV